MGCDWFYRYKFMQPNHRLKLTAPSVHAFCISATVEDPVPRGEKARPSARS